MADRGGGKKDKADKERKTKMILGYTTEEFGIVFKKYRTPIASATASLISTGVAVRSSFE
jgi:hypothetical protein